MAREQHAGKAEEELVKKASVEIPEVMIDRQKPNPSWQIPGQAGRGWYEIRELPLNPQRSPGKT